MPSGPLADANSSDAEDCRTCGGCCAYCADWPRFSLESEAELAAIPERYTDHSNGRMKWVGRRCAALSGTVGITATCLVYDVRPLVCRDCEPGDDACLTARRHHGLSAKAGILD
jgi:Fe-S-cluster containining protein